MQAKDPNFINKLLKKCISRRTTPQQIFMIWNDIIESNNVKNISQGLVLRACSNILKQRLLPTQINTCIDILNGLLLNNNLDNNTNVYCLLIHAFGLCSDINRAERTFYTLSEHNVNTTGALMNAYIRNKHYDKAISIYKECNALHNDVTHLLLIQACANTRSSDDFEFVHEIISNHIHYMNGNCSVKLSNALIDFYGKCNDIPSAEKVFQSIPDAKRNSFHTNAMISCYLNNDSMDKCLMFYEKKYKKDNVSHLLALKACTKTQNFAFGTNIITKYIAIKTFDDININLMTSMIDFYGSFGDIKNASKVFDAIAPEKHNIISISVMMNAYCDNEMNTECMDLSPRRKNTRSL